MKAEDSTSKGEAEARDWIEWLKARDAILGDNEAGEVRVADGLAVARKCRHPDAVWLCGILPYHVASAKELCEAVECHPHHQVALLILALVGSPPDYWAGVERAALAGSGRAAALMAGELSPAAERRVRYAQQAAALNEPAGFYELWRMSLDEEVRGEMLAKAAHLGLARAQDAYADKFKHGSREWCTWKAAAAAGGHAAAAQSFLACAERMQSELSSGLARRAEICYYVGGLLQGHVDEAASTAYGILRHFVTFKLLLRLVRTYASNQKSAREAVENWLLVAHAVNASLGRVLVNKDVRGLVARTIWQDRWCWSIKFH